MGDEPSLTPFTAGDSFLRHIDKRRLARAGIVTWEVFKPRGDECSLSFTYQNAELSAADGLTQYHLHIRLPSGDLPGICKLTYDDLTSSVKPPLEPRWEARLGDVYGHLHCVTDRPRDQSQMEQMAKLATRNGLVREFQPHQRRGDAT